MKPLKNQESIPIVAVHGQKIGGRIVSSRLSGQKASGFSDDEHKRPHPSDIDFRSVMIALESKILNDGLEKDNMGVVDEKCCDECSRGAKLIMLSSSAAAALPSQVSVSIIRQKHLYVRVMCFLVIAAF